MGEAVTEDGSLVMSASDLNISSSSVPASESAIPFGVIPAGSART